MTQHVTTEAELEQKIDSLILSLRSAMTKEKRIMEETQQKLSMLRLEREETHQRIAMIISAMKSKREERSRRMASAMTQMRSQVARLAFNIPEKVPSIADVTP